MASISIRLMFIALLIGICYAQPPPSSDCSDSNLLSIINSVVTSNVTAEPRMGASIMTLSRDYNPTASLLRLHFHDCFVNGCDGSILLDDDSTIGFVGEKTAGPNDNSLRGFEVIDNIKSLVEAACPSRLSCADILAVAARDAVVVLGGESWDVTFGRNDSTTASLDEANNVLPGPTSDLIDLVTAFSDKGFNISEMVALSGSHTIGQARCRFFRNIIYTEANINPIFAATTQSRCPQTGGDDNLSPLDISSPEAFNNDYYKNLVSLSGLFHSDQQLFNNGPTDAQDMNYVSNPARFAADFASAMAKMAMLVPPSGAVGQIRTNCRRVN